MSPARVLPLLLVSLLVVPATTLAQSDRGALTGTVTDASGAVVPGVTVTATNTDTGEVREAVTTAEGLYSLQELKAGPYRVPAELQGFKASERSGIQVAVLDPAFAPSGLSLAKVYVQLGRLEDAVRVLQEVVRREANLPEAHYQLGRVYARLQRQAEAAAEMATFDRLRDVAQERAEQERQDLVRRLATTRF